jgi:hypothetical protein
MTAQLRAEFATKEDLRRFATKQDLRQFATKEEMATFTTDLAKRVEALEKRDARAFSSGAVPR